ncbi:MAG TPA: hypothetical protein VGF75_00840 [Candidatus Saccharimonadales bacterium]|jgi:hypothetical protein
MQRKIVKNLIYAQISFFFCLIIDVVITTKGFSANRGLSFYGEHLDTVIPFAIGFFLCDFFILRAAKLLPELKPTFEVFIMPFRILALLLILIVLTPDNLNGVFNVLHNTDSSSLFLFELILGGWLVFRWHNTALTKVLLASQFIVGIICGMSEFQFTRYLSESSLAYQLIFSILLVLTMSSVVNKSVPEELETMSKLDEQTEVK